MKISGYGAKAGGNFILLASSDFSFSGLLIRKSLNLHHREFHVSGTRTFAMTKRKQAGAVLKEHATLPPLSR